MLENVVDNLKQTIVRKQVAAGWEFKVSLAHFRGCYVQASTELGPEDVSLLERCPHFRGCYVQALMELGPEDVPLLERCPHFRGCYEQASMELGPEDVSLLERCPHFRGCYVQPYLHCVCSSRVVHSQVNQTWLSLETSSQVKN